MFLNDYINHKIWYENGYFEITQDDFGNYICSYIYSDSCGGNIYHPRLTVSCKNGQLQALQLYDTFVTPIVFLKNDSMDNQRVLDEALQEFLERVTQATTD